MVEVLTDVLSVIALSMPVVAIALVGTWLGLQLIGDDE